MIALVRSQPTDDSSSATRQTCYRDNNCETASSALSRQLQLSQFVAAPLFVELAIKDPETGKTLPAETRGEICIKSAMVMKGTLLSLFISI